MKKYGLAVLVLAAAMSLGTVGISAMAATGWTQEGNTWVYYNSSGGRVSDAWRQGADGYWRYLNSNGTMAVDAWVDSDNYYVDASGLMVSNKWLQVTNSNSDSGYDWYYFSQSGKNIKDKWEQIDGKWYHFSDTGAMETGWILDDMYYCEPNGVMVTGWKKLDPPDSYADDDNDNHSGPFDTVTDDQYWYYFATNGKKAVPDENSSNDNIKQKKINGVYYCLREDGAMQTGWVCVTGDDSDTIEDYRYVDSNGQVRVGWYSAEPPEDLQNNYDHDVEWFYFSNKGVPKVGPARGSARTKDFERINGNTYLFDEDGVPVYGLQKIYTDSDESEYTSYYFGTREQSCMMKGKFNINESGDTSHYYFSSTGRGYTGVYDNYLYYMGKLQKADSGSKYEVFTINSGSNSKNYVINTSGHIAKGTTVKDRDGVKYKTNSGGVLIKEDDETVDGGTYTSPEEPDWDIDQD
ncbi:MAG: cell wall-binding protein [Lachnospiraceae bacterium]|nr:cell wall-binding protein [Lachnospiraceae bacterium]